MLSKKIVLGLIYRKNFSSDMCFFIYKIQEITILIIIVNVFARKKELVPQFVWFSK